MDGLLLKDSWVWVLGAPLQSYQSDCKPINPIKHDKTFQSSTTPHQYFFLAANASWRAQVVGYISSSKVCQTTMAMVGLATQWEAEPLLRNRGRVKGALTAWPTKESIGVTSMGACALNSKLLEITAHWWVSYCDVPSAIPIELIRTEVFFEVQIFELL